MSVLWKSFVIAFSMYSRIPMPKSQWEPESMQYAVCFFPLVGAVLGAILIAVDVICSRLLLGDFARGTLLTAVPILVTGGIHMDGFLDTVDARSSFGDREKKLEILKDPHGGAFAILYGGLYLLVQAGLFSEMKRMELYLMAVVFVLSRALSGFALATFRGARKKGLLASFADGANKRVVIGTMFLYLVPGFLLLLWLSPVSGAAVLTAGMAVFLYYRLFSYGEFGGITGDLAGYFVQLFELVGMIALVAAGHLLGAVM